MLEEILSNFDPMFALACIVIGALWREIGVLRGEIKDLVKAYHEDSKTNTIAINALVDWVKDRSK